MTTPHNSDFHEQREGSPPHEALLLVLPYLTLFELLSMTQVCVSLRDAVEKDILPWLDLRVQGHLSTRLSDEILLKFASRANGRLRSLVLVNCVKITDDGLLRVIEMNPLINKLYLPGCTGLTPEGIINVVRIQSVSGEGIERLRINGIYNLNREHLQTLYYYLKGIHTQECHQNQPPVFFHLHSAYSMEFKCGDHSRVIDVDICPKCNEVKMIFSCPKETCTLRRDRWLTECVGCSLCIPRCIECGGCVDSEDLEEALCRDILCLQCWLQLPKCSFCNKPYCKLHANKELHLSRTKEFICSICEAEWNSDFVDT